MSASTPKTSIASTRATIFRYDAEWTKRSSAKWVINRESLGPHQDRDEARRATPRTILDTLSAADDETVWAPTWTRWFGCGASVSESMRPHSARTR